MILIDDSILIQITFKMSFDLSHFSVTILI